MITHDVNTWGVSRAEFENTWPQNIIGKFQPPISVVRAFNNFATDADKDRCFNAIANTYITAIRTTSKGKNLNFIPFQTGLMKDTKDALKDGLYGALQHACKNQQFWEKMNGSSVTTPNFTLSNELTGWLLTNDVFGKFAHNSLTVSGLADYVWVTNQELITLTNEATGRVEVIGKAAVEDVAPLITL